MKYTEHFMLNT